MIAASVYSHVLASTSWDGRYGIFGHALREVGTVPLSMAILFGLMGVFLMVTSVRKANKENRERSLLNS